MTTDLTGDFGLGEEEFDWDVFLPDPEDTEIDAEAIAREDEDELDLDDSDFDWEAALREDPEPEAGTDGAARAGAAYDRIVDTVRRSFEEPEPEAEPEADADPEPVVDLSIGTVAAAMAGWEPQAEVPPATALRWAPEPEAPELHEDDAFEPETWLELEEEPTLSVVAETGATLEESRAWEPAAVPEPEPAWFLEAVPETEPEPEAAEARIAEMAATVAAVAAVEAAPSAEPDALPDLVSATAAQHGETSTTRPAHARKSRTKDKQESEERSRVFTGTVVLACAVLVVIAVAAVTYALHLGNPAGPSAVSSASATARIQTATDAIDSATTSATVGFSSMGSFPTPSNVERIINPYMSSLQLYGTLLSESKVPAAARSDASSAEAQVRQDLQFLDTIDGLPSVELGAYLKQFDADATQLQTTLSALEQNLRAPAS